MPSPFPSRLGRLTSSAGMMLGLALLTASAGCKGEDPNSYENMKKKQGGALAALEQAGGKAVEKRYKQGQAYSVTLKGAQITDETLAHVEALGSLSELDLSKSTITDNQMAKINDMGKTLLTLNLSHTAVTDSGLAKLTNLYLITSLNLTGTKATDAGVKSFLKSHQSHPNVLNRNPQILR